MSAEVESMVYVSNSDNRFFRPWHGLGVAIDHAMTSDEALKVAELDWKVNCQQLTNPVTGGLIDYYATIRDRDNKVLGVVKDRYTPVQNDEAFAFTDALIGEGVSYETAGSLLGGSKIWMLAKMPETEILGDKFEPYLCFTNQHDGKGSVQVCMTPIRVVCNNTLNMALQGATKKWSTRHVGNMESKLADARDTLGLANKYMAELAAKAEKMAATKMSEADVKHAIEYLFPVADNASDRQIKTVNENREVLYTMYIDPNIANFIGTQWGFINAVSDYVGHRAPKRDTQTYSENRFNNIVSGTTLLDKAYTLISA